ncbi:MAG: SpoIIIAC/SpoIIIAD family protein [Planctomycetota bacterium]
MVIDILYFIGITLATALVSTTLKQDKPKEIATGTLKLFLTILGCVVAFCVIMQIIQSGY